MCGLPLITLILFRDANFSRSELMLMPRRELLDRVHDSWVYVIGTNTDFYLAKNTQLRSISPNYWIIRMFSAATTIKFLGFLR